MLDEPTASSYLVYLVKIVLHDVEGGSIYEGNFL